MLARRFWIRFVALWWRVSSTFPGLSLFFGSSSRVFVSLIRSTTSLSVSCLVSLGVGNWVVRSFWGVFVVDGELPILLRLLQTSMKS